MPARLRHGWRFLIALVAALGLMLQGLPTLAAMQPGVVPLLLPGDAICHAGAFDGTRPAPAQDHRYCPDHWLCCQVAPVAAIPAAPPPGVPSIGTMMRRLPTPADRPDGPPSLAYASRAPPDNRLIMRLFGA